MVFLVMVMVAWVWTELKYCSDVCRAVRCAYNALHNSRLLAYILLYCKQNFFMLMVYIRVKE